MKAVGVIPARYDSTRFPGKVLADLLGKPLVQYVYEAAVKAQSLSDVIVACDDERVLHAVQGFGGRAVLTAKEHASGSDRIAEVVNPLEADVIVNIQADEPLISSTMIDDLVHCLFEDAQIPMASLIYKIEDERELDDPNVVKVVKDKNNFALYFSRLAFPYLRDSLLDLKSVVFYKHLGIYAYTKDFLFTFTNLPAGNLEKAECLEQLRVLENGYRIKLIETTFKTIGVDTPADLEKAKLQMLQEQQVRGIKK